MKHLIPLLTASAALGVVATANITAAATDDQVTAAVKATIDELTALKATEATQAAALNTATAALTALKEEHEATAKKLTDLEAKEVEAAAAAKDATALAAVQAAVKEGRILASQEPHFVALAKADFSAVQSVLAALPARKSLTDQVSAVQTVTAADGTTSTVAPLTAAGAMAEIMAKRA